MIVTVALAGIILLALAGALAGALRSLAVQKARTQGNEVATLGIESLQNVAYNALGVCAPAAGAPSDMSDAAPPGSSCSGVTNPTTWEGSNPGWGAHPCRTSAPTSGADFIRSSYTCSRNNITYNVRRYVAWGDNAQTAKRLAVFVDWRDAGGVHQVSQQSSLRAPGAQDIAGLPTPTFTQVSVSGVPAPTTPPDVMLNAAGNPNAQIAVSAQLSGLTSATDDKVFVTYNVLDASNAPDTVSTFLTSANGTTWSGNIPTTHRFGSGSQYFFFSTIRAADGKGNAAISALVTFVGTTPPPPPGVPTIDAWTATSSAGGGDVKITSAGALVPTKINLTATTSASSAADTVQVVFETRSGATTAAMRNTGCTGSTCTWVGEVPQEAGYSFATGTKKFYFTIAQRFTVPGTGSTAAKERDVVFNIQ